MRSIKLGVAAAIALGVLASTASADFTGLPISGNLNNGSAINDSLIGAPDNHDGFFSGGHFFDIWLGGDKAYTLNWLGGDMTLTLTNSDGPFADPDLFLYRPSDLNESSDYSAGPPGFDQVNLGAAPAGTYYIVIDTTAGSEGDYHLAVTPEPGTACLLLIGGLAAMRRRR